MPNQTSNVPPIGMTKYQARFSPLVFVFCVGLFKVVAVGVDMSDRSSIGTVAGCEVSTSGVLLWSGVTDSLSVLVLAVRLLDELLPAELAKMATVDIVGNRIAGCKVIVDFL